MHCTKNQNHGGSRHVLVSVCLLVFSYVFNISLFLYIAYSKVDKQNKVIITHLNCYTKQNLFLSNLRLTWGRVPHYFSTNSPSSFPGPFPYLGGGVGKRPWERGCQFTCLFTSNHYRIDSYAVKRDVYNMSYFEVD